MVVRASVNLFVVEYHQVVAAVMGVFDQRGVGDQLHFVGVALHAGQVSRFGQRRVKIRLPHGGVFADVNLIGELLRELVVDVGVVVEPVGGLVIVRVDHLHFVQPLDVVAEHQCRDNRQLRIFRLDRLVETIVVGRIAGEDVFIADLDVFQRKGFGMTVSGAFGAPFGRLCVA